MIEDLFNKIKFLILFKVFACSIILSNGNLENISHKINPSYNLIFKNIGFDLFLNSNNTENLYFGLQWMVSHNMSIDFKSSIRYKLNEFSDIDSHNIFGGKLILNQKKNNKVILSFSANKLRYTDSGNYTWLQNSLIFLRSIHKYSLQLALEHMQINGDNITRPNIVGSYNIFENIFLYLGLYQSFDSKKNTNSFLSLGVNL